MCAHPVRGQQRGSLGRAASPVPRRVSPDLSPMSCTRVQSRCLIISLGILGLWICMVFIEIFVCVWVLYIWGRVIGIGRVCVPRGANRMGYELQSVDRVPCGGPVGHRFTDKGGRCKKGCWGCLYGPCR